MRHGMVNRKLGRTSSHRGAMFRNQLASLIEHERIVTTLPKAKELRPLIEKLVTLGKTDSVHARRQAAKIIANDTLIAKLFGTLGPRFAERPGGYCRIIKLGQRRGDAAEMAILEFVGYEIADKKSAEKPATAASATKKSAKKKDETAGDEEPVKEKKAAKPKKAAAPKADKAAGDKPKKKPAAKKKSSK